MHQCIEIDSNINRLPIALIHQYLNTTYWAEHRSLDTVRKTIEHSLNFGIYRQNEFIGFARVVTDYGVIAYLGDVFILPPHQGKGYGKLLMQHVMDYDELKNIRRWLLATMDAHGLYAQFGFTRLENPFRWMEVFRKDL